MARGGSRIGAGRKPGSVTKRTRDIADAAMAKGISPLEYLLGILRDETQSQENRTDAAKSAAPYVHPKLSAIEANVKAEVNLGTMLDALDG